LSSKLVELAVPKRLAPDVPLEVLLQTSYPVAPEDAFHVTRALSMYAPSLADTPVGAEGMTLVT
jgi:hypothetical protein